AAFDAGVLVDRPWGDAGPSALTAGIALARIGAEQRRLQAARAEPVATHETTVEVAARWKPTPALALQPLVQQVWRVAGRAGTRATIVGVRIEWALSSER
ncbi:MAG TPA: carbohydrate porin, partial [Caldimonas sp.]